MASFHRRDELDEGDADDLEVNFESGDAFVESTRRKWLRAENPLKVLVDGNLKEIAVQLPQGKLNVRKHFTGEDVQAVWNFEVSVQGMKYLKNVSLAMDNSTNHFTIKSVLGDSLCTDNMFSQHYVAPVESFPTSAKPSVGLYIVEIQFQSHTTGTFCQDVLFGFNKGPVIRRQICIDCILPEDEIRLEAAREYLLYLCQQNPQKTPIVWFKSPFVPERDIREYNLCQMYPKPELDQFFLTHTTLKETALDRRNYRRRLHELVTIEEMARREQIARYNEVTELRLSNDYILTSDTDASTVAKYVSPGELFAQLPLGREISEDTKSGRLLLRSCNYLLVQKITFSDDPTARPVLGEKIYEAHIEDKCNHSIYVRLSKECVDQLGLLPDTNVKMYVQFVMNRTPFCEWHRAIDALPDTRIVFPEPKMPRRNGSYDDRRLDWSNEWTTSLKDCRLNDKQKEAVAIMMAPSTEILPPVLLLGPFGTGKTSTIAQALRILLVNDLKSRVILCTHSNSAADLYVKEFFDLWYKETKNPRLKPLRIYYTGRSRTTVHAVVREYCPSDRHFNFRDPTNEDLAECGLVISTLATSSCLMALDYSPTHIIIDEAAQALECEALSCLALANERTRLVLAGDQMQLAPEVYSDLARERNLGMSLLERIHLNYEPNHPCRIQLCTNYRAHKDIVNLTSDLFYLGKIEPGASLPSHPKLSPLTFYACEGNVMQGSNSTGYYNAVEAAEIAERVSDLRRHWPADSWGPFGEGSIGVLAHYAEQVLLIRGELRKRRLFNVSVERVLNVQGKQFTAVFISVVRTRHCSRHSAERQLSDYGFLTNARLLNTAVTRAKSLVAVVGDPVALLTIGSCSNHWRRYLRTAGVHGMDPRELDYHLHKVNEPSLGTALNPLAKEFIPRTGTQAQNPYWIEYVPMPINYPVIHCSVNGTAANGGVV
ncbi:probable helicase with zinc finger domain [Phymastichus coffea]|uniref:probable helicase with zinc finger domain n=1 Tax=Phymastichus coffea TaxID=108790 RepID=UPI00273B5809|nr:probable helicase with zinc finger domain [Phymastichus coffea]